MLERALCRVQCNNDWKHDWKHDGRHFEHTLSAIMLQTCRQPNDHGCSPWLHQQPCDQAGRHCKALGSLSLACLLITKLLPRTHQFSNDCSRRCMACATYKCVAAGSATLVVHLDAAQSAHELVSLTSFLQNP